MAEINITSITPTMVKEAMTKRNYDMLFYDGAGVQSADQLCLQAISSAFSTLKSKIEKSGHDITDITTSELETITTAFIYFTEASGQAMMQNWGLYHVKKDQAIKLLADLWGGSVSDEITDGTGTPQTFLSASVQPLTYTAKETQLYNNNLWN